MKNHERNEIMHFSRIISIAAAVFATCLGGSAHADWKPTKTIDVIVHTGPGGGNDVLARTIANMLEKEKLLPVRMQVVNKPGGNGAVAAAALAEKKGDTHTLGLITSVWIASPLISSEAKVTLHDLTPVTRLVLEPAVFVVRADSPYKTMHDFIEAARAKPGQLKQSGGSLTSRDSIMRQALQQRTGTKWAFVSFQGGGERIAALLGGHVDMMIIEPQEAGEHIRAGKMRVLAQIADHHLPAYPGVPTLKEAGYDVTVPPQIRAVMAPPGVPKEVIAYWEDLFGKLRATASWKKYILDNQLEEGFMNGMDLAKSIDEIEKELRVQYQQAGVKLAR
ncbi:MAG: putative tricarboxylic transport rane protein [Herminiimonas sp.]|nr:putative tricarboxylic transport rane protein [Herminiimonas sp.]